MSIDIVVPANLWDGDDQAVVTVWLASDGGQVVKGRVIAEIMVEKTQYEIAAPADGTLKIASNVDDIVEKGSVIGTIV